MIASLYSDRRTQIIHNFALTELRDGGPHASNRIQVVSSLQIHMYTLRARTSGFVQKVKENITSPGAYVCNTITCWEVVLD